MTKQINSKDREKADGNNHQQHKGVNINLSMGGVLCIDLELRIFKARDQRMVF